MSRQTQAFTLIELLIVVLIIAILAAIAVPNFLEFQTRAKVSRAKSDMRTIATALEAYYVDNNVYTEDHDGNPFDNDNNGLYKITTPIAYLSTALIDQFAKPLNFANLEDDDNGVNFLLGSGSDNDQDGSGEAVAAWMLVSVCADQDNDSENYTRWPNTGNTLVYDPTNGSVSNGDIYRFGGGYRTGNWLMQGRAWSDWQLADVMPY